MEYINILNYVEIVENLRRERILRDRLNPVEEYDEENFFHRYRFHKNTVLDLLGQIQEPLQRKVYRHTIAPVTQLLVTLRFYATGAFLKLIGDSFGIHASNVSRIVKSVSECIARQRGTYITFPTGVQSIRTNQEFLQIGNIPGVVGAIDCTHIPIQAPKRENAELFRNRKGYFSVNVQAICDSNYKFTNIVARWPGSTHDSR